MGAFPFPDKENSMKDLKRDYVFGKIDPEAVEGIFLDAWHVGEQEARKFMRSHGPAGRISMTEALRKSGLLIRHVDKDYVLGNRRYFCEYLSRRNLLKVYTGSVALWCEEHGLAYEDGLNVILCHEYFHYLECHEIGPVSKRCQVPMVKIGSWEMGKTGVPALSEVAADAFARTCLCRLLTTN